MGWNELNRVTQGKIHHYFSVSLSDGSVKKGHLQPFNREDNPTVYLTPHDGVSETVKVKAADIKSLECLE